MLPDTLSVILRSASFIALFQAAGMALFLAAFGRPLQASRAPIRRIARLSAITAAALLVGQYALEAARMADDISGVVDPSLQRMVIRSASSVVLLVRLLGLALIAVAIDRRRPADTVLSAIAAAVVAGSFMLIGHTAASPHRWLLAPLLTLHVLIVAFWFGALVPLYLVSGCETPALAGEVTEAFSTIALWLVPGILIAGVSLTVELVRHLAEFRTGYGLSLIAKFAGFVALMGLAALNKWRLGPAIAARETSAVRAFRRSVGLEYALIAIVLGITADMTTFYSPEP